jgi:hypothetical protein
MTAALLLPGCGGGPAATTSVQGSITYQKKPANNGVIAFSQAGGRPISAAIQSDGTYAAQVPPGDYQVRIDAPPPLPPDAKEGEPLPPLGPRTVPEKYANFSTSGLTVTIGKESPQQLDYNLP